MRQTPLVVEFLAVFNGGRPPFEQAGTALGDDTHIANALRCTAEAVFPVEAFPQRDGDGAGHGFAGQTGEFCGEAAGLVILDVQAHGGDSVDGYGSVYHVRGTTG